jgi:MFS family permease
MTEWWNAQAGTWIGALGGAGLGTFGGLLGAAIGVCAPRGIGRKPILAIATLLIAVGVISLIAGIVAAIISQPRHVYYPLLLIGFILTVVLGSLMPVTMARYRAAEQRRIDAQSIRQG